MRTLILLAGAALFAGAAPALADPGKAKGKGKSHIVVDSNRDGIADYRQRNFADINMNGVPDYRERRMVDINRNGIPDFREQFIDRNRDGIDDRQQLTGNRFGGAACPPGLASKSPACIPPGQAKKLFREGQRLSSNYRYYTPYNNIPPNYRLDYGLNDSYRYIYRNDYIYEVDPTTSLIRRVINLLR